MSPKILIVIPARYHSTRFPGKPLALISGVTLVQRVYRLCCAAEKSASVIVATDDSRIQRHVLDFGGRVMMTRQDHPSGTDRVAEVARRMPHDIIINVQGDEPLLEPATIQKLTRLMLEDSRIPVATLAHPIHSLREFEDPNAVKVVTDLQGNALYFSRSPIPHLRGARKPSVPPQALRHIGIYAFRRERLLQFVRWKTTALERIEKLEQLRILEHGTPIRVLRVSTAAMGVDVPSDIKKIVRLLRMKS